MKKSMLMMVVLSSFLVIGVTWAEESKPKADQTESKSRRKKKVEICAECGKPETECDCPGYLHEKGKHPESEKETKAEEKKN